MSVHRLAFRVMVVCASVLLIGGASWADSPKWTYVEGGYLNVDIDNLQDSGDNWFLGGAFGGKAWHVIGQYADGDASANLTRTDWRIGLGWHGLLGERADVVAEMYFLRTEVGPVNDSGYRLTGGIRWLPIKLLEVDGFVNYADAGNLIDGETSYELRGILNVWRVGIGVGYEKFSDVDQYNGFVRFNFK